MIKIEEDKFYTPPPLSQNPIFMQKGGDSPKINKKIQPILIELKCSGKTRSNKGFKLGMKIFIPPPLSQNLFFMPKKGGGEPPKIRQKFN